MALEAGSEVRVKTIEELCELYHTRTDRLFGESYDRVGFVDGMADFMGTEQVIERVHENCSTVYRLECGFWWPASALEELPEADLPGVSVDAWSAVALK